MLDDLCSFWAHIRCFYSAFAHGPVPSSLPNRHHLPPYTHPSKKTTPRHSKLLPNHPNPHPPLILSGRHYLCAYTSSAYIHTRQLAIINRFPSRMHCIYSSLLGTARQIISLLIAQTTIRTSERFSSHYGHSLIHSLIDH